MDPVEIPIECITENIVNVNLIFGDSLVHVIFNPLNGRYYSCEVSLYYTYTKQGEKNKTYQFMGNFKSEKDKFFIPITNLGYGPYAIVLKQYDENNELIYESEIKEFVLRTAK